MLIFRVTQKLATKLKIAPTTALPRADDPLTDWTANLFVADRVNQAAGRVPPDAFLFVQAATKRKQKRPVSCGGHLFRRSSAGQLTFDASTGAALLGTEGGARFLCGPPKAVNAHLQPQLTLAPGIPQGAEYIGPRLPALSRLI